MKSKTNTLKIALDAIPLGCSIAAITTKQLDGTFKTTFSVKQGSARWMKDFRTFHEALGILSATPEEIQGRIDQLGSEIEKITNALQDLKDKHDDLLEVADAKREADTLPSPV